MPSSFEIEEGIQRNSGDTPVLSSVSGSKSMPVARSSLSSSPVPSVCGEEDNDDNMLSKKTSPRRFKLLAAVVDRVQGIRIPSRWQRVPTNDNDVDGSFTGSITSTTETDNGIPLITGLDRVVFGTKSMAEVVRVCNIKPPQYLWYMLSGAMCDVLQLIFDLMLNKAFGIDDPSICWGTSFFISICFRHTTHRYFVFGDYVGGYYKSLLRMYAGYSIIIVLSTIFNFVMTHWIKLPHYIAWVITLLWTGIVNFFILKKLWSFTGKKNVKDTNDKNINSGKG